MLITDIPSSWAEFPGEIIEYSAQQRNNSISRLVRRFPERNQISGSYWIYTLERLFSLEILGRHYPLESPMVHIESDCYSFIDDQIYHELLKHCTKVAVPRYSSTEGIASVLFSPTLNVLNSTLNELGKIVDNSKTWLGDMNLLGIGLNTGLLNELPTRLADGWELPISRNENSPLKLIFDGLAIGQYLLGQDPYHSNGYAIPGHVNEYFPDEISKWKWGISSTAPNRKLFLFVENDKTEYRIANVHVHSKILVPSLKIENEVWTSIVDTANGNCEPIPKKMPDNQIHTGRISMLNKIRFARRNGFMHLLRQLLIRVFKHYKSH